MQRIGIILAAGRGRRMGRTKQLVAWPAPDGDKPLVAAAFDSIARVCDQMILVLGHEADAVAAALGERRFEQVHSDPDAEMFKSIRAGLELAKLIDERAVVVLQPGDQPVVLPNTLAILLQAAESHPDVAVMPENAGCGGHPVFIPPRIVSKILSANVTSGLAGFWVEHASLNRRVVVDDPGTVFDVDTAEELQLGRRLFGP